MTNEQILKKAIEKASKNGWDWEQWAFAITKDGYCCDTAWLPAIIFSHSFAKAFWGKGESPSILLVPNWQYHLQQMVLAEDPFKYLEEFL